MHTAVEILGIPSLPCAQIPLIREAAARVPGSASVPYAIGTMIEVPRACLTAGAIAEHAEFFSFGTNDLTAVGQWGTKSLDADLLCAFLRPQSIL